MSSKFSILRYLFVIFIVSTVSSESSHRPDISTGRGQSHGIPWDDPRVKSCYRIMGYQIHALYGGNLKNAPQFCSSLERYAGCVLEASTVHLQDLDVSVLGALKNELAEILYPFRVQCGYIDLDLIVNHLQSEYGASVESSTFPKTTLPPTTSTLPSTTTTTTTSTATTSPRKEVPCIQSPEDCRGKPTGDYRACVPDCTSGVFYTCVHGRGIPRNCPMGWNAKTRSLYPLVYDPRAKRCEFESPACLRTRAISATTTTTTTTLPPATSTLPSTTITTTTTTTTSRTELPCIQSPEDCRDKPTRD